MSLPMGNRISSSHLCFHSICTYSSIFKNNVRCTNTTELMTLQESRIIYSILFSFCSCLLFMRRNLYHDRANNVIKNMFPTISRCHRFLSCGQTFILTLHLNLDSWNQRYTCSPMIKKKNSSWIGSCNYLPITFQDI